MQSRRKCRFGRTLLFVIGLFSTIVLFCLQISSRSYIRSLLKLPGVELCKSRFNDVFLLSRLHFSWERFSSKTENREVRELKTCRLPVLSVPDIKKCILRRSQERHQKRWLHPYRKDVTPKTHIEFIGDSRVRNFVVRILQNLNMSRFNHSSGPPPAGAALPSDLPGSWEGGGPGLQLRYWYSTYMGQHFEACLSHIADWCALQLEACPSLVVINSGLWYARRFSKTLNSSASDWMSSYRRDLSSALLQLRRLASLTTVLWKLEEAVFLREAGLLDKSAHPNIVMDVLPVQQAVAMDLLRTTPGLILWSALIPEASASTRSKYHPSNESRIDAYHVRNDVLDSMAGAIWTYLC